MISFGGVGTLTHFAFAPQRVADLQFGDFNGDGKTDVLGVVGDLWMVTYGGTGGWSTLRPKLTDSIAGLIVADFNGDGRADVVRSRVAHGPKMSGVVWEISLNGVGGLDCPRPHICSEGPQSVALTTILAWTCCSGMAITTSNFHPGEPVRPSATAIRTCGERKLVSIEGRAS